MFDKIDSLKYFNKEIKFYTLLKRQQVELKKFLEKNFITITWMDNMKQGDIVIDIGANVGMYSLMSSVVEALEYMRLRTLRQVIIIFYVKI